MPRVMQWFSTRSAPADRRRSADAYAMASKYLASLKHAVSLTFIVGVALFAGLRESFAAPVSTDHADLWDICFVQECSWAVGDHGVIWHSNDAGATWKRQQTPFAAQLRDVCFLDRQNGWVVGTSVDAVGHPHGVLWQTSDGGETWSIQSVPLWPAVCGIAMKTVQQGWAWGSPAPGVPSGVFYTKDGGLTWLSLPGLAPHAWSAGSLDAGGGLMLASRGGSLALATKDNVALLSTNRYPSEHGPDCRAHVLIAGVGFAKDWWLVAREFGRVELMSEKTWNGRIEDPAVHYLAGVSRGNTVWLGGSPGSQLWQSPDFGRTWSHVPTGWTLPIHGIAFSSDEVGCFVSALGNILRTTDGGKNWERVQGIHDRIAILAVVPTAAEAPWELLADAAVSDYLTRVAAWCGPTDQAEEIAHAFHAACLRTGATAGELGQRWRLPISPFSLPTGAVRSQIIGDDSSTLNGSLPETMAQAIRLWRPSAIVTVGATVPDSLATLSEQSLRRSIELAAFDTPSADSACASPPWKVSELWTHCPCDEPSATVRVARQQLRPLYEDTVGGASDAARLMLRNASRSELGRDIVCFRRVLPSTTSHGPKRLLDGVPLARGAPGRLAAPPLTDRDPREWHERVASQRNAHALLSRLVSHAETETMDESLVQVAAWNRLLQAAEPLNPLDAGPFLYRLGGEYQRQGVSDLAVDTMRGILRTGDNHGYARPALEWLWRWETSAETQYLSQLQNKKLQNKTTRNNSLQSGASRSATPHHNESWPTQLMKLGRQRFADWDADPQVRLSYIAWCRGQNAAATGDRPSLDGLQLPMDSPWKSMVSAERWIETGRGSPPWPMLSFKTVVERPHLDGKLLDECWAAAAIIPLVSTSLDLQRDPSRVLLTGDEEYLYLAIECPRVPGYDYLPPILGRIRDPDLRGSDRVELVLDVNRDYSSAWKLVIDYRGAVGESLLGSSSWNPAWFVAAGGDDHNWRVEAAIPWHELAPTPPRSPWIVGAVRVVPERDVQTSQPAIQWDGEYLGLNLLQFE